MKVIPIVKNKQGKIMVLRNYTYLTFLPNSYSTSKKTHPFFNNRIVVLFSISIIKERTFENCVFLSSIIIGSDIRR